MRRDTTVICCAVIGLAVFLASCTTTAALDSQRLRAAEPSESKPDDTKYPLDLDLAVLERDLSSDDYRTVLETMIPTDLAAEWLRVGTADNYFTFLDQHGGLEKVTADPELKAAYERRKKIADDFLALMREAYVKRKRPAPFDEGDKVETLLKSARGKSAQDDDSVVATLRVVMPSAGAERQWPRLRGPTGQGTVIESEFPAEWSATKNVAWKTAVSGRGNSSPVVWNDRIFLTAASEDGTQRSLLCFGRADGSLLWTREMPRPAEQEQLYWKNTYATPTPVTDGERVIAFFGNSGIASFRFDGELEWHVDVGTFPTMHGPGTSPVLYKDKVILVQDQTKGDSLFAAFDKATGIKVWQHPRPNNPCWSTPVIIRVGEQDQLIHNGSANVVGYDPDTGHELWSLPGSSIESIPSPVVGENTLFCFSGRNGPELAIRLSASAPSVPSLKWSNARGGPHVPSPLYYENRIYVVNDTGIATCLNAADGKTVWQERLRGRFSAAPTEAGGKILLLSEDGVGYVIASGDEFKLLAENDLGEPALATPAVLDGSIYFRTANSLMCVSQ